MRNRVAVVTGAGSGIGRATCLALARQGARVLAVARNLDRLNETAALARAGATDADVRVLSVDVRSEADVGGMARAALEAFGRIDLLVSAAGVLRGPSGMLRGVAQLSADAWDDVLDTNLKGTFLANRAVLPAMIRQGRGDILNLSSISGRSALPFDAPYGTSKWGMLGLTEALADEVRGHGVRVQVLLPGPFQSPLQGQRWATGEGGPSYPPADRVADVIVYMASLPADTQLKAPVVMPFLPHARASGHGVPGGRRREAAPAEETQREPTDRPEVQLMTERSANQPGRLYGQVVIVTGGAGGIGLAVGKAVASEGASVVLADVQPERVEAAAGELAAQSPAPAGHLGFPLDVRDEAQQQRMAQVVLERFGRIDALVACAGILRPRGTAPKPLAQTSGDEWDEVLDINLRGVFLSNRAVLPAMIRQRAGTIINISSVSGLEGRAYDGPYCASKFGVLGLTQSLADEVRSHGVKVSAILPGAVATPIWEQNHPVPAPSATLPPERVADLIVFMLTQPADTLLVQPVITPLGERRRRGNPRRGAEGAGAAPPGAG